MVEAGQTVRLKIVDVAFGGDGVGRLEDFVLFVPFVIPGEEVEVEVTEAKKNFARARLIRVLSPSPERVDPPCPYFGDCGGCQYQHIGYSAQLRIKHKQVRDLFERIGKMDPSIVQPIIPSPQSYHYRNRIMVRSQWNKPEQRLNIGFLRHDNRLVVDIEECKIAEPSLNEKLQEVRRNPPPKGGIKVMLRMLPEGWDLSQDTFFQNNFFLLPSLVAAVRERLQSAGTRFLIDAYCGVGFFSIELSNMVERFVGVEVDAMGIKSAIKNAQRRGVTNGEYLQGRTEDLLESLLQRFPGDQTTIVLDPPRTGCAPESLHQLRSARLGQILYISCHPATLARDLKALMEDGVYEVQSVIPLDMFPQTQHVECIADLRLKRI